MKLFLISLPCLLTTACSLSQVKPDDGQIIKTALFEKEPVFRECRKKWQSIPQKEEGKVVAYFVIGPDGKVTETQVQNSTLNQPEIERCILNTIQAIQFSPLETQKTTQVLYSFEFNSQQKSFFR